MTIGPVARDDATAEFFDGSAAGQFLLRHCLDCGRVSAPQAAQCEHCDSTRLDWAPASGRATLVSWAVLHARPAADGTADRTILCIAELAEGPWWWSQLTGTEPDGLRAGLPLQVEFQRHDAEHEAVPVFAVAAA
jgi:uncharacterized OB-fold protein